MGYIPYSCGFQRLTSSGVVSDAGKPIILAGWTVLSGATAAIPYFNNGAALVGSSLGFRGDGVGSVNQTTAVNLPVMFPNGCFVSFDVNTTEVTVFYVLQSTSS